MTRTLDLTPPDIETSRMKVCPQCGSSAVDYSLLAASSGRCAGCGWEGPADDLLSVPVYMEAGGETLAFSGLYNDLRRMISKNGVDYLRFLLKWGFLQGDPSQLESTLDRRLFARYLASIARAVVTAVVEERRKQEVTRAKERQSTDGH